MTALSKGWARSIVGLGAQAYDLTIPGAMRPGSLVSGYLGGQGIGALFYDSQEGVPYIDPVTLASAGGWTGWVHVSPTGRADAPGTEADPTTWDGYWSRAATGAIQPGQWALLEGGVHTHGANGRPVVSGVNGLPTAPFRAVSKIRNAARLVGQTDTTSLACFGASRNLGFHGIDFDGGSRSVWGLCLGERFVGDNVGVVENVDVWHCRIHHPKLSCMHVSTSGTKGIHVHGSEVGWSGQNLKQSGNVNEWGPYSELLYFGTGAGSASVTDWAVDWCWLHDSPAGEAIDGKNTPDRARVAHNLIERIRVNSQGAVTFLSDGVDIEVAYNLAHDLRRVQGNEAAAYGWTGSAQPYTAPPGWNPTWDPSRTAYAFSYEGGFLHAGGEIDAHHNVVWDCGDSMVVHLPRDRGSGHRFAFNLAGAGMSFDYTGSAPFYRFLGGAGVPVFAGNVSIAADTRAASAAASNFVNPTGARGSLAAAQGRTGWGYQIAAGSALPASMSPLGKALV